MSEYSVIDPTTGHIISEYPTATDADVEAALSEAHRAFADWRKATVLERAMIMRRVAELHAERREALAAIIEREMGKPVTHALGEVDVSVDIYTYYADHADEFLADQPLPLRSTDGDAVMRRTPLGVILGIMPWNYPYYQVARFTAPNLVLGNTVVLKHAPQCPESAAAEYSLL